MPTSTPYKELLLRIHEAILENANINDNQLAKLAKENNIHAKTLSRHFTAFFGVSLPQFVREQCMKQAYQMITSTDLPLKDIADHLGYSIFSNFSRAFRIHFKQTPQDVRSKMSF